MPLAEVLDSVFLAPLTAICGAVFEALRALGWGPGGTIIAFAIAINALLSSVYRQMEQTGIQLAQARAGMDREIARVRRAFRGREQYFYIQTIHRHYGHRPWQVLWGSGELWLQVAVFSVVFRYLSGLEALEGARFLWLADLGQPDGLLWGVNSLPLLMTTANIGSTMLYAGEPRRRRWGYLTALAFLVLLYSQPSGLVLYWTTNNLYSLTRIWLASRQGSHLEPAAVLAGPGSHS